MQKNYAQLSLPDVYEQCQRLFENDKPKFLALLESTVDIADFIPQSFYNAFYRHIGRDRLYPLEGFISALILQKVFSIPSDTLLILILRLSKELRTFCGFLKVPDGSKFTRFKQDFLSHFENLFNLLVDFTEPLCRLIDAALADMLVYDTTGIESYVAENNPKHLNSLIKQLKSTYENKPEVDPYKMAYGVMPSCAAVDQSIEQMYINGHFCYARKVGIVTNGLGIIRHIAFLDEDFVQKHDEVVIEKKSHSPDEDKSIGDSTSLQPVLKEFFELHPTFRFGTFLGDSAFDKADHYAFLKDTCGFEKALIPINKRNESTLPPVGYNEYGYPLCPNDDSLVMKYCGITRGENRSIRIKWTCPKMKNKACSCEEPCSTAKFGRATYTSLTKTSV